MKVFYRPEQSVNVASYSPSAGKPARVLSDWQRRFGSRVQVCSFDPVSRADLCRVHDESYVDGVLALRLPNGFGTLDPDVARAQLFTSGSLRAAALAAWRGRCLTVSPTSGFHHANHARGGKFCTFNGLVLAALAALDAGAARVAIVDCDQHYGDGTDDILKRLRLDGRVSHWTLGAESSRGERRLLARLAAVMRTVTSACDLVIYQAGADSHVDDPLGGVFSSSGYRERERIVFGAAAGQGVPLAWNLAGGYQSPLQKVLDLHAITMDEALAVESLYAPDPAARGTGPEGAAPR